jgi:hypothetical protein
MGTPELEYRCSAVFESIKVHRFERQEDGIVDVFSAFPGQYMHLASLY